MKEQAVNLNIAQKQRSPRTRFADFPTLTQILQNYTIENIVT